MEMAKGHGEAPMPVGPNTRRTRIGIKDVSRDSETLGIARKRSATLICGPTNVPHVRDETAIPCIAISLAPPTLREQYLLERSYNPRKMYLTLSETANISFQLI